MKRTKGTYSIWPWLHFALATCYLGEVWPCVHLACTSCCACSDWFDEVSGHVCIMLYRVILSPKCCHIFTMLPSATKLWLRFCLCITARLYSICSPMIEEFSFSASVYCHTVYYEECYILMSPRKPICT